MRDKKEFNVLRSDETRALRERIFAKEDDIRECTFHPRTAINVAPHVQKERDRISDRMDASKLTGIKEFVQELEKTSYRTNYRKRMLSLAKKDYVDGSFGAAMAKLESNFGVQQILDRFKCHHPGCGKLLPQTGELSPPCACAGFYCTTHKPRSVHNCDEMKKILGARAKQQKEKDIEMRERGETVPSEEQFDNKVELGMIIDVYALASHCQCPASEAAAEAEPGEAGPVSGFIWCSSALGAAFQEEDV